MLTGLSLNLLTTHTRLLLRRRAPAWEREASVIPVLVEVHYSPRPSSILHLSKQTPMLASDKLRFGQEAERRRQSLSTCLQQLKAPIKRVRPAAVNAAVKATPVVVVIPSSRPGHPPILTRIRFIQPACFSF